MKSNILILTFIITVAFVACKEKSEKNGKLGLFDISSNNKDVIFSYATQGESSIYCMNINNEIINMIVKSTDTLNFYNPKYSPNGNKILYIASRKKDVTSSIYISNSDGSKPIRLTNDGEIITEATFSLNGKNIFYCKANNYDNYSSLGRKNAHNFDIYSLQLEDNSITKVTNLNTYGLSSISEIDSQYILAHIESGPDGGMYLLSKREIDAPQIIIPNNNPRSDPSLYYTPIYSDWLKKIAFTAPYELYLMGLDDKVAKLVLSNKRSYDFSNIVFFKQESKLLFSDVNCSDFYIININDGKVRKVPIIL